MPRTFSQRLVPEELAQKIAGAATVFLSDRYPGDIELRLPSESAVEHVCRWRCGHALKNLTPKVCEDLGKVHFGIENLELKPEEAYAGADSVIGFRTLPNGLTYLGVLAGGDWEQDLVFIVYWDGRQLRGYIPTQGNPWNTETKKAYGNNYLADLRNAKSRFGDRMSEGASYDGSVDVDVDGAAVIADIQHRIVFNGDQEGEAAVSSGLHEFVASLRSKLAGRLVTDVCPLGDWDCHGAVMQVLLIETSDGGRVAIGATSDSGHSHGLFRELEMNADGKPEGCPQGRCPREAGSEA